MTRYRPAPLLYLQARSRVERAIRDGRFKPGAQLPSEQALMRAHGVSRITIRRALDELVRERLVYRVPGKGTFVAPTEPCPPDALAIRVMMGRVRPADVFYHEVLDAIQEEAQRLGIRLVVERMPGDEGPPRTVSPRGGPAAEGVLWVGYLAEAEQERLGRRPGPVVLVDTMRDDVTPAVMGDNVGGARQIARHVLDLGHRVILYMTVLDSSVTKRQRRQGWEQALREAGRPPAPDLVVPIAGPVTRSACESLWDRIERTGATAVCCANDGMAAQLMGFLLTRGIKVPGDLSVTGFDDVSIAEPLGLTTVSVPRREMGRAAVWKLVHALKGIEVGPPVTVLPVALVVRPSTGAPPARPAVTVLNRSAGRAVPSPATIP